LATPVFSLSEEILTDAPLEVVVAHLSEPTALACLRPFGPWSTQAQGGGLQLSWRRRRMGSEESGTIIVSPHEKGAYLRLEARHRGWTAFGSFGLLRWHSDQLLERIVEAL
jgi:hypothetical protein